MDHQMPFVPIVVALVYGALCLVLLTRFRGSVALARLRANQVALALVVGIGAYGATAAVQSLVAPTSWVAAKSILLAVGADDGRLAGAGPATTFLILVRACVLAPVGEELLFRGAAYGWLRRRLPAAPTIGITAAAFTVIHGFAPIFPLAFALGCGFGWVRERTGSTTPGIAAHVLNNVALVAASYALTGWTERLPAWSSS